MISNSNEFVTKHYEIKMLLSFTIKFKTTQINSELADKMGLKCETGGFLVL